MGSDAPTSLEMKLARLRGTGEWAMGLVGSWSLQHHLTPQGGKSTTGCRPRARMDKGVYEYERILQSKEKGLRGDILDTAWELGDV